MALFRIGAEFLGRLGDKSPWGPPTAPIDWCEENYARSPLGKSPRRFKVR
jgi:hypothetical protein